MKDIVLLFLAVVLIFVLALTLFSSSVKSEAPVISDNCVYTGTIKNIEWYFCEGLEGAPDFLANDVGFTQVP